MKTALLGSRSRTEAVKPTLENTDAGRLVDDGSNSSEVMLKLAVIMDDGGSFGRRRWLETAASNTASKSGASDDSGNKISNQACSD